MSWKISRGILRASRDAGKPRFGAIKSSANKKTGFFLKPGKIQNPRNAIIWILLSPHFADSASSELLLLLLSLLLRQFPIRVLVLVLLTHSESLPSKVA